MRIGIDPGLSGAIGVLDDDGVAIAIHDMPIMARISGKGQEVNPSALASILMQYKDVKIYLELVHSMPRQGVASSFRFGEGFGVVKGVIGTLQKPLYYVTPAIWKKRAGLTGKQKDAARTLAINTWPEIADQLTRKKDCDRADALLIAKFGKS